MNLTEWQKRAKERAAKQKMAKSIVKAFEKDLNSRNRLGFDKLSKEIQEEIRKEWTKIVMTRLD